MSKRILVVDDESRIREVVQYALAKEGFQVTTAADAAAALEAAKATTFDLIVLDVMLPDGSGLDVCRELRRTSRVPILFLSARSEEIDRVVGLEIGGDDYLGKPFSPRELVARVRAIVRRAEGNEAPTSTSSAAAPSEPTPAPPPLKAQPEPETSRVIAHGGIEVDADRHEVRFSGKLVSLTPTEFGVLGALLERPGVVLSRGQLMQRAYRYDNLITERTIDTHVRRIRAKFRAAGGDPIATVHGVGYKAAGG